MNQKILHEQEAEKTLLALLSSEESAVTISGCDGLMAMCSLQSSRQLIGLEGGLPKLLQCVQSEVGDVRAAATRTIAKLINGAPANQKSVVKWLLYVIVHVQHSYCVVVKFPYDDFYGNNKNTKHLVPNQQQELLILR